MADQKKRDVFRMARAVRRSNLKGAVRHLALELALHADEDGGSIFPLITTLEGNLNVGRDAVLRGLKKLRQLGVLEVVEHSAGRRRAVRYRMIEAALTGSGIAARGVPQVAKSLPV